MNPNAEPPHADHAPAPRIKRHSGPSLVWLIPLITALIGGWLIFKTLSERGPQITLSFKTAEGIEAGKTKVKYKNMEIGTVLSLRFSDDFDNVILTIEIAKEAQSFLRRDTRFWVVKPRLGLRGVSGLSTLISGAFIEIEPGKGAPQRHFVGLESPPVVNAEQAGKKLVLMAQRLGSVDTGSPVYYQGITAGEVLGYELANDQHSVLIYTFIKSPFDQLVRGNSRFWNVSGMDVSMDAEGFQLHTESVTSMLYGGIAFETPTTLEPVEEDVEGLVFTLYDNYAKIAEHAYTQKIKFVLFFEGSVRGLAIGAPVEFRGIKVGSVADIRMEFDSRESTFRIPVVVEIEPERVIDRGAGITSPYQTLKNLVERGLRARLETGSLLTGQLYVDLDMRPDTPIRLVGGDQLPIPELPTIPAGFDEITGSVKGILTKLEKVDFDRIGKELEGTLAGANQLVNAEDLKASVTSLRSILRDLDQHSGPVAENVDKAIAAGQETLAHLNQVLKSDSPAQYRFNQMTEELAEMARSIRTLVDLLERDPQSLLFGKNPPGGK